MFFIRKYFRAQRVDEKVSRTRSIAHFASVLQHLCIIREPRLQPLRNITAITVCSIVLSADDFLLHNYACIQVHCFLSLLNAATSSSETSILNTKGFCSSLFTLMKFINPLLVYVLQNVSRNYCTTQFL